MRKIKTSEHEEMITHTVDKIARLEDERERLLMDIGKAKARALHLTSSFSGAAELRPAYPATAGIGPQ